MRRRFLPIPIILVAALIVATGLLIIQTVSDNQDTINEAEVNANVARALVEQAVQSRADSVRLACEELNRRHDDLTETLNRFRRQAVRRAETAQQRAAIKANQRPTRLFIDALAPERDCEARARELVPEAF